ncbi:MAG TPA: hypothetical protein VGR16_03970 [Thermomicrobiales bacterium]|nr:hypothetical protein [Thermomicrobiales bacterium]
MFALVVALFGLALGSPAAIAQDGTPPAGAPPNLTFAEPPDYPELTIMLTSEGYQVPAEVEAGRLLLTFENQTDMEFADAQLMAVPEGISLDEIKEVLANPDAAPAWLYDAVFPGGAPALAGGTGQAIVDLTPGEYVVTSTDPSLTEVAGLQPFTVVEGEDPAAADAPPADVTVTMIDFAIELPQGISAGPQVWEVTHEGDHPHFRSMMQSPEPITDEQIQAILSAEMAGEAPPADGPNPEEFMPVSYVPVLSTGETTWIPLDLSPGYYVVACFVPTQTGDPHAMLGMVTSFEVAA